MRFSATAQFHVVARLLKATGLLVILGACEGGNGGTDAPDSSPEPTPPPNPAALERLRPDLAFSQPVDLKFDAAGHGYVVEQAGMIRRFDPRDEAPATVFLDIRNRVLSGGEQGLLGLALEPDFAASGRLYVNYTTANPRRTVIARYTAAGDAADAASEAVILEVAQPFSNHNAGALAFGPEDGRLYVPLGDGGGSGDPQENGQDRGSLLGSVLRLDVSASVQNPAPGAMNYAIPPDNPFVGNSEGAREEIYAFGFRNPFKFSFDRPPGGGTVLWLGDVGQNAIEEVDQVFSGFNYGWNTMEGSDCFDPPSGCSSAGLTLPVAEYGHDVGRAITGGYVYRGNRRPDLAGHYLYADFITGVPFALPADLSGPPRQLGELDISPSGFARDADGEVYLIDYAGGGLYRIAAAP